MRDILVAVFGLAACALRVQAECANACNGHGKCTSYDMCICHRNWQANDCSERKHIITYYYLLRYLICRRVPIAHHLRCILL